MNRQTSANATTAQRQSPPRLTSILGSFLEVITHEIIYTRSLYPRDAFSPTRHFGIACHACRHPDVVDYIFETLQVAVAGIVSGLVDGLYLIFYDSETDELLERFAFEFQLDDTVHIVNASGEGAAGASSASDGSAFAQGGANAYAKGSRSNSSNSARVGVDERQELERKIQELERSLRDVLLKIVSLDGTDMGRKRGQANFSPSVTFKLCLHTVGDPSQSSSPSCPSSKNSTRPKCPELEEATSQGKWFRADSESCSFRRPTVETGTPEEENALMTSATPSDQSSSRRGECVTRPLKSINVPSCGLNLQLMVEFLPTSY